MHGNLVYFQHNLAIDTPSPWEIDMLGIVNIPETSLGFGPEPGKPTGYEPASASPHIH